MKKRIKTKIKTTATPYLFLFPCAALILVILIYPVLSGIINSFYNESLIRPVQPEFVALDNYKSLLTDSMFLDALRRSVLWTLVILVFELFFGLLFAVLLNKDIYCKKLFRCLVLIPWIIPNAIAGIIWKWFLNESFGMMNYILKSIGIISHNLSWLSDEKLAAVSVVMVIIWKSIPFVAITLLAGIQAIPGDLYEAAKVDGANIFKRIRYITLPQIKPTFIILLIYSLGSIMKGNFELFYQTVGNNGLLYDVTDILDTYVYRITVGQPLSIGLGSAAGLFQSIFGFVVVMVTNWAFKKKDSEYALF